MSQSEFVGVDWCPSGWLSVGLSGNCEYELKTFPKFGELLAYYETAKLMLVDIPIGLPDKREERPGDIEAKSLLGPRKSSVFRAPTRSALDHLRRNPKDKEGASNIQFQITGESIKRESFGIMPMIAEVDSLLPHETLEVREVHPEVCFWALNDGPMPRDSKRKLKGVEKRIQLLKERWPETEKIIEASYSKVFMRYFNSDDLLDALVAAVTAYKGYPNDLQTLPKIPPKDPEKKTLPMEMVFWKPPKKTGT